MQKAGSEKTGLGRKVFFTGVALACLAGVGAWLYTRSSDSGLTGTRSSQSVAGNDEEQATPSDFSYVTTQLSVGGRVLTLDIADTEGKKHLGLGQRDALPADKGMLFVYQDSGIRCFWMKDMRFAIDIIWLNADKQITHLEPSLSPATYPQQYCPEKPARYVLETAPGMAQAVGLKVGDTISLHL